MMNPAQSYFRAMALEKLGQTDQAKTVFHSLVNAGSQALQIPAGEAGPAAADMQQARQRLFQSLYAPGLGHMGLGETDQAKVALQQALVMNPAHVGVRAAMATLQR